MGSEARKVEEGKIQIGDVEINFIRVGTGDHPVLLLPELLGMARLSFATQIEDLDIEKLTLVAWDPPGYGKSWPPDRTFPDDFYQRDATWAHSLMKTLGYSKFSLIGMFDGAVTALFLAAMYPESIRKMIVLDAKSYVHLDEIKPLQATVVIDKVINYMKKVMTTFYGEDYIKQTMSRWLDTMFRLYHKQNGDLCKQELLKIKCPTLIFHISDNSLLVPDQPLHLKQNIANSTIYFFQSDTPDDLNTYLDEFNKRIAEFLLEK
ncbi:hypothetical protein DMN91_002423 [Ooceraea biroi]|uniref:Valacyclovir hydrolase n=1 Tax=Ooceraea biroi TaxID=2015173 RepID=A0A026WAK3_OOCBI|nr:valacyclovir hydrolase [Ooceraea biroi]EZA53013.1 Valacyclovir hydrolase [Ooceraea biroi]RLU24335.1 hypothetical protein DMN91_002423 [Ooceraea biroi]